MKLDARDIVIVAIAAALTAGAWNPKEIRRGEATSKTAIADGHADGIRLSDDPVSTQTAVRWVQLVLPGQVELPDPCEKALDEIHRRESSCGQDPKARPGVVGPAGEEGEYQITPIFRADVKRLFGVDIDPHDRTGELRYWIWEWLRYYAPRVGASTVEELYQLYHLGPTGFRDWKGINR